ITETGSLRMASTVSGYRTRVSGRVSTATKRRTETDGARHARGQAEQRRHQFGESSLPVRVVPTRRLPCPPHFGPRSLPDRSLSPAVVNWKVWAPESALAKEVTTRWSVA